MSRIELTGYLVCADEAEAAIVVRHLPRHIELTRAEKGCERFDVLPTDDPLVWAVTEQFVDEAALEAHRVRVRESEWGRATPGIKRRYLTGWVDS